MQREWLEKLFDLYKQELVDYILAGCKEKRHLGVDVSIKLNDSARTFLTRRDEYEDFCKAVRERVTTPRTCVQCDDFHFNKMIAEHKTIEYTCHAYLNDLCIPISDADSGEIMAGLFAGQLRRKELFEAQEEQLKEKISALALSNRLDPGFLWAEFLKSPLLPEKEYREALKKLEDLARDIGRRFAYYGRSVAAEFSEGVRSDLVEALLEAQESDAIWTALHRALVRLRDFWGVDAVETYVWNDRARQYEPYPRKGQTVLEGIPVWMTQSPPKPPSVTGQYWLPVGSYGWAHISITFPEKRSARYLESVREFSADLAKNTNLRLQLLDVVIRMQAQTERIAEMTSTLAHQAATPLTAIRDLGEKLYDHYGNYTNYERRLGIRNLFQYAQDGCTLMLAIIDATDDGGALTDIPRLVNVRAEIEEMRVKQATMLHERQMCIRNLADKDMPDIALRKPVFLHILYILVDNALKYSDTGEDIEVRGKALRGHLSMEVASRGVPIAADEIERIFRKGYRTELAKAHTARRETQGSGLGLWIAKLLLNAVGGTIRVEVKGRRTMFEFTMPIEAAPKHIERR